MTENRFVSIRGMFPDVPKVSSGVRPFWSVIIPTYRRYDFLKQTLQSVCSQYISPEQMEIEVSDDDPDPNSVYEIIESVKDVPVKYYKQQHQIGQFCNVNSAIRRAKGHWIHVLHDDDWIVEGFYEKMAASLPDDQNVGAALSSIYLFRSNNKGNDLQEWGYRHKGAVVLSNILSDLTRGSPIQTPAVVVRRSVYETLGGYEPTLTIPGDLEMWLRISSFYSWWHEPSAVAIYRVHDQSVSEPAKISGDNISQSVDLIRICKRYLPVSESEKLVKDLTFTICTMALRTAKRFIEQENFDAAGKQIIECLKLSPSKDIVLALISMKAYLEPKQKL